MQTALELGAAGALQSLAARADLGVLASAAFRSAPFLIVTAGIGIARGRPAGEARGVRRAVGGIESRVKGGRSTEARIGGKRSAGGQGSPRRQRASAVPGGAEFPSVVIGRGKAVPAPPAQKTRESEKAAAGSVQREVQQGEAVAVKALPEGARRDGEEENESRRMQQNGENEGGCRPDERLRHAVAEQVAEKAAGRLDVQMQRPLLQHPGLKRQTDAAADEQKTAADEHPRLRAPRGAEAQHAVDQHQHAEVESPSPQKTVEQACEVQTGQAEEVRAGVVGMRCVGIQVAPSDFADLVGQQTAADQQGDEDEGGVAEDVHPVSRRRA